MLYICITRVYIVSWIVSNKPFADLTECKAQVQEPIVTVFQLVHVNDFNSQIYSGNQPTTSHFI